MSQEEEYIDLNKTTPASGFKSDDIVTFLKGKTCDVVNVFDGPTMIHNSGSIVNADNYYA